MHGNTNGCTEIHIAAPVPTGLDAQSGDTLCQRSGRLATKEGNNVILNFHRVGFTFIAAVRELADTLALTTGRERRDLRACLLLLLLLLLLFCFVFVFAFVLVFFF